MQPRNIDVCPVIDKPFQVPDITTQRSRNTCAWTQSQAANPKSYIVLLIRTVFLKISGSPNDAFCGPASASFQLLLRDELPFLLSLVDVKNLKNMKGTTRLKNWKCSELHPWSWISQRSLTNQNKKGFALRVLWGSVHHEEALQSAPADTNLWCHQGTSIAPRIFSVSLSISQNLVPALKFFPGLAFGEHVKIV